MHKQGSKRTLYFQKTGYKIVPPGVLVLYLSHIEKSENPLTPKYFPDLRDSVISLI